VAAGVEPDVFLDVEVERGLIHFVLACEGAHAHDLRARFSRVVRDAAGLRLNDNPLFTRLSFLPAGRRVRLLVDTLAGYQERRQPMAFDIRLEWRCDDGRRHRRTLHHDLGAWLQLREVLPADHR